MPFEAVKKERRQAGSALRIDVQHNALGVVCNYAFKISFFISLTFILA